MRISDRRAGVTLRQVAEEAGVSIAAVSKVLHGRGDSVRVGEERAQAIRKVAERLNYVPNLSARQLRTNRTNTVGLLFENFGEISAGPQYYVHLLDGVASELFSRHYRLTILPEFDHHAPLQSLADGRVDGLIWCKLPGTPSFLDQFREFSLPCVALNAPPPQAADGKVAFVSCDNNAGSWLVINHLVELGHRRILFALERREEDTPDARARLQGFFAACHQHGIWVGEEDVVTWSTDAQEFPAWWNQRTGHTAIYAWNERLGAEILRAADRIELRIPEQLSVVGFDSTQYCETTVPRLTAVNQPIREMSQYAAKILLDQIEGGSSERYSVIFPCTLDVRDSTAIAPRPHSIGELH